MRRMLARKIFSPPEPRTRASHFATNSCHFSRVNLEITSRFNFTGH